MRVGAVRSQNAAKPVTSRSSRYLSSIEEKRTRERRDAIAQYYRDHDITLASQVQSNRLKAVALLYTGKLSADERYFFVCTSNCT